MALQWPVSMPPPIDKQEHAVQLVTEQQRLQEFMNTHSPGEVPMTVVMPLMESFISLLMKSPEHWDSDSLNEVHDMTQTMIKHLGINVEEHDTHITSSSPETPTQTPTLSNAPASPSTPIHTLNLPPDEHALLDSLELRCLLITQAKFDMKTRAKKLAHKANRHAREEDKSNEATHPLVSSVHRRRIDNCVVVVAGTVAAAEWLRTHTEWMRQTFGDEAKLVDPVITPYSP